MPHPRLAAVRQRYDFRCGYCGVSEVDSAGELTVDHYQPVTAGGDDADDNLVYACPRCNTYKGDFFPSSDDLARGVRVLHPLLDDVATHIEEDQQSGRLAGITDAGRFHITLLHLNRPALVEHRLRQRLDALLRHKLTLLEAEIEQLRATVHAQDEYIRRLRRLVEGAGS